MSEHSADKSGKNDGHHVERIGVYLTVFIALMVLLLLTYLCGKLNLDRYGNGLNLAAALTIAVIKAVLVILFFMHVRHGTHLTWIFAASGFAWMLIMLTLSFTDLGSRHIAGDHISPEPVLTQQHRQ